MNGEERKAAVAAYKERKVESGVFAVRCCRSGQSWVGSAPDLSTVRNRLWFTLRHGSNPHASLQAAWNACGGETFTFEIIERLAGDDAGYLRNAALKSLVERWTDQLRAIRI